MAQRRNALIVASDTFEDPRLRQLRAPGTDAQELAAVLSDPRIGDFDVRVSMNERNYEVRLALEDFFDDRRPDDVLLLHFSCHGIKDEAGRLFFAVADTQKHRLNATAIAADYVNDLLNQTRSRRVVLFLDCCFSGAFTRGMLARGGEALDVEERFHGRGRAVLTATSALEYAWEGDGLARLNEPSIFTSAVVRGLRSGEADRDGDQLVSVDDLYDYVFDEVRRRTPNQTPGKWSNVEGALIIAHSARSALAARVSPASPSAVLGRAEGDLSKSPELDHPAPDPRRAGSLLRRPDWLPVGVIGLGWIVAWLASLVLAGSPGLNNLAGSLVVALTGWLVGGPLIGAALCWAAPEIPPRRASLVGIGWPACIVIGVLGPIVLQMGGSGTAVLGVSIGVAGALAGLALAPLGRATPWDRVALVATAWLAGWLWFGVITWPEVFSRVAAGTVSRYDELMSYVPLSSLVAGPVLSGLAGGLVAYLVLVRPMRSAS